jgi:hypothetical protein
MSCYLGHAKCKRPADVGPGDVVLFLGTPHLIERIDPYEGPLDWALGIARDRSGWGITLGEPVCVEVG